MWLCWWAGPNRRSRARKEGALSHGQGLPISAGPVQVSSPHHSRHICRGNRSVAGVGAQARPPATSVCPVARPALLWTWPCSEWRPGPRGLHWLPLGTRCPAGSESMGLRGEWLDRGLAGDPLGTWGSENCTHHSAGSQTCFVGSGHDWGCAGVSAGGRQASCWVMVWGSTPANRTWC